MLTKGAEEDGEKERRTKCDGSFKNPYFVFVPLGLDV